MVPGDAFRCAPSAPEPCVSTLKNGYLNMSEPIQYFEKLQNYCIQNSLVLTEKLKESLFQSCQLACDFDVDIESELLMAGLIKSKSVIVPILDTCGVDIPTYYDDLIESALSVDESFSDACDAFDAYHHVFTTTNVLNLSKMAFEKGNDNILDKRILDSSSFIKAMFRGAVSGDNLKTIGQKAEFIARTPLSDQILSTIDEKELKEWYGDNFVLKNAPLKWLLDEMELSSFFLKNLQSYIPNIGYLLSLEKQLEIANIIEPYIDHTKLIITLHNNQFLVTEGQYLNTYDIKEVHNIPLKINYMTKNIIRWEQIEEFEHLINKTNITEYDLQRFFEKHPKFLLGSDYQQLHSQLILVDDTDRKLMPDFFAEKFGTNFCDIIDIKKPNAKIISGSQNRRGFSASLTAALNQLREYRCFFDSTNNRKYFHGKYGLDAFRPTICVVIGRSGDYLDYIERIQIEDEYKNLKIMTYDDVLVRAKKMATIL